MVIIIPNMLRHWTPNVRLPLLIGCGQVDISGKNRLIPLSDQCHVNLLFYLFCASFMKLSGGSFNYWTPGRADRGRPINSVPSICLSATKFSTTGISREHFIQFFRNLA